MQSLDDSYNTYHYWECLLARHKIYEGYIQKDWYLE